jgi:hypothetical protein
MYLYAPILRLNERRQSDQHVEDVQTHLWLEDVEAGDGNSLRCDGGLDRTV